MTSHENNRCPQCNTGFFNTPNERSAESLLARCQYCNYQRDSTKCPNCERGYLERPQGVPGSSSISYGTARRILSDPKHLRCRICDYKPSSTGCPNCGRGVLEWRLSSQGEGRVVATWSSYGVHTRYGASEPVHSALRESRGCSTCGYIDPSSIPSKVAGVGLPSSLLGRLGCLAVLAIVLLVVFSFASTCIFDAIS